MKNNLVISIIIIGLVGAGLYYLVKNTDTSKEGVQTEQTNTNQEVDQAALDAQNAETQAQNFEKMKSELTDQGDGKFFVGTLKEGGGEQVSVDGNVLAVRYAGYLQNGEVFDNNVESESLFEFTLGGGEVIQGWDMGLKGMKAGEVRRLIVPAELAYGENAVGPIPANSTLIFDVELVSIK